MTGVQTCALPICKSGTVESIDFEKETAKVLIDFLGNQTPMEIDLVALEKTF